MEVVTRQGFAFGEGNLKSECNACTANPNLNPGLRGYPIRQPQIGTNAST